MRLLLLSTILLAACSSEFTYEDAHDEWVQAICEHAVMCNGTGDTVPACVKRVEDGNVYCITTGHCSTAFKDEDAFLTCLDEYRASCSVTDDCARYLEVQP